MKISISVAATAATAICAGTSNYLGKVAHEVPVWIVSSLAAAVAVCVLLPWALYANGRSP